MSEQLWPDAYVSREDAEAAVAEWKQRAEAAQKDAVAFRYLAYERTQRKDAAEATLAAERARAEAAEHEAAALRASTEAAAVVYLRSEVDQLRAALAAAAARAEAAEARAARVDEYASYYAAAWEAFEADSDGPEPLCFAEWLAQQCEVQS